MPKLGRNANFSRRGRSFMLFRSDKAGYLTVARYGDRDHDNGSKPTDQPVESIMTNATRSRGPEPGAGTPQPDGRAPRPKAEAGLVRRLTVEVVGTYFLVIAAAGGEIVAELHPGQVSAAARALAPALVVAAMIYAFGSVSGAHFNPAVTVAFAARTVFPWRYTPAYVAAQLAGAVAAAGTLHLLLSPIGHEGTTYPRGAAAQSLGMEVLLTTLLVVVILSAATQHRLLGPDAALPVGATIAACGLIGSAVSGASMNPARSVGPAIVAGIGHDQWIYIVGPLAGAMIAVAVTSAIHGPPKREEREAAEGSQNA
jgi:aquaporin Z